MNILKPLIPHFPLFISTFIDHFTNGPPQPSWDVRLHLSILTAKLLFGAEEMVIEVAQRDTCEGPPLYRGFKENEIVIPNQFRKNSQPYIERIIKEYEYVLDDGWKQFEDDDKILTAKWIYSQKKGFQRNQDNLRVILYLHGGAYFLCSADTFRQVTTGLVKSADALVFAINYRLAPQNQFPAGLHDAISAYLYLTNPPEDAGFDPIDPKRIVIIGDSAGGGLTLATLLALRDAGLPMPAGVVCFSPWLDLTHSMPSFRDPRFDLTDYLPRSGIDVGPSPAYNEYLRRCEKLSKRIKAENRTPFWDASLNRSEQLQLYAINEALGVPYVSPLCAESLAGLPPMLIQIGDGEKLRDESIYFSFKASQPEKYQLPAYNAGTFERSPFKTPTNVTLEIYEDMPHVFQVFDFCKPAQTAYQRSGEFIKKLVSHTTSSSFPSSPNDLLPSLDFTKSTYSLITAKGKTLPLNDEHMKVLEWTEVGKVPPVNRPPREKLAANLKMYPFVYFILAVAMITYILS